MRTEVVLLSCGHWFRERRPDGLADPVNAELRACAHPEHYPRQYPALYLGDLNVAILLGGSWTVP